MSYTPLPGWDANLKPECFLAFYGDNLILPEQGILWPTIPEDWKISDCDALIPGYWQRKLVGVINIEHLSEAYQSTTLRRVLLSSDSDEFVLLSHAFQLRRSRGAHRFCGCCGSLNYPVAGEWAMACSDCKNMVYPRISPCIIVLVSRNDEVLLVQHHRHGQGSGMHTLIAGFIEPGESAEHAVHREVKEEAGITLGSISYQFSQSWPFPHSLMFGFHGKFGSGELVLDDKEIYGGGWFKRTNLPELPPKFSISRQLIDEWISNQI